MEIWISQADKEHAENLRCPNSTQSVYNLDGLDKEEIPRAEGRQIQGKDEVPKDNERRDHAESSGNEVWFNPTIRGLELTSIRGAFWIPILFILVLKRPKNAF